MLKYKTCKTCKKENEISELMCVLCAGTVFDEPSEELDIQEAVLKLLVEGLAIEVKSGEIVGREAKGEKYFRLMTTISREHAKFILEEGQWYIEDLNSSNGSYLESLDNRIYGKKEIKNGDKIYLSRSVMIEVVI